MTEMTVVVKVIIAVGKVVIIKVMKVIIADGEGSDGDGDSDGGDDGDANNGSDGKNEEIRFLPSVHIEKEQYYAMEFVDRFYYGRALAIDGNMVTFKFLHSKQCAGVM